MITAILQARLSSTRLLGKVMLPLAGRPMIERQFERMRRATSLERIVLATSDDVSDAPLAALCKELGVDCYRGSLTDVLDRYYQAALVFGATVVVRITGDCPLIDPQVIDKVVAARQAAGVDYASNAIKPSYPDGLDVEVMRMSVLEAAWREAKLPSEREHVTPFIWNRPQRFSLLNVQGEVDLSALRWTVDTPNDYVFVCRVYDALYARNPGFRTEDVLALLRRESSLGELNAGQERNEGYAKSIAQDRQFEERS